MFGQFVLRKFKLWAGACSGLYYMSSGDAEYICRDGQVRPTPISLTNDNYTQEDLLNSPTCGYFKDKQSAEEAAVKAGIKLKIPHTS